MKTTLLFMWLCIACVNSQQMSIQRLKILDTVIVDSFNGKIIKDKFVNYKITGYKDNDESLKYITDFIEANRDSSISNYSTYKITFFKASYDTNEISLKQHPGRYYNLGTTIYSYKWLNGKFVSREKFDDGKIVEPKSNIVIKDMPLDKD